MTRTLLLSITSVLLYVMTQSAPAMAAEPSADQLRVSLAGIDTSSAQGADRVLRRIRHAAADVCDLRTGAQPRAELVQAQSCVRETVARTVTELGDASVSARFASREGEIRTASR